MTTDSFLSLAYRYFAAVAEVGSVRAAARLLGVVPSAISRQVGLLEQQLAVTLFERRGRQLALTEAGAILRLGLRAAGEGLEGTLDRLAALKGLQRGRVRLATVESLSVALLPQLLQLFAQQYPGLEISVTVAGSEGVSDLVRRHEADLAFTFNPQSLEGLAVEFERSVPVGVVMAPAHALARKRQLTLADCLTFPLAWPSRQLSLRQLLDRVLPAGGVRPRPVFECNSLRLMASLARSGACLAFQTPFGIEPDLKAGLLLFRPLPDVPPGRLLLVRRTGAVSEPAAQALLSLAAQQLPRLTAVRRT